MDDTQVILTTKQVLYNFSLSREQLRRWTEKGLQRVERGQFELKTVIQFRDQYILGSAHEEMQEAKLRRELAKARLQELETAEKEGSLVPKSRAVEWLMFYASQARAGFLNLPQRCAPELVGKDVREIVLILRREVHRIFQILYEARKDAQKMIRNGTFLNNGKMR